MGKFTAYNIPLKSLTTGEHLFEFHLDKQFFENMEFSDARNADIDVALNGHTHRFRHYAAGESGCLYPVVVGGGPSLKSATMTIVRKQNKTLSLEIINAQGQTLKKINL